MYSLMSGEEENSYHVHLAWRVAGPLNLAVLEQSLNAIIQRHEILRTTFPVMADQPVAVIADQVNLRVQRVDLQTVLENEREGEALRRAAEEVRRPFDLARGPLLRAAAFQLFDAHYLLVVTVCHMVFDGWSMRVFSRELGALYAAFAEGRPSPLPDLPVQWLDFVCWQNDLIRGAVLDRERSYWRSQLETPYFPMPLTVDHPRSTAPSGSKQPWELSRDLTEKLNGLAQQENATHFTALLAAIQSWLHCHTGQEDVMVFASTFARILPETRGLIGLFANVLPLRSNLAGNPTFREVLCRVRDVTLTAFAHQSLPFENILEMLPSAVNPNHNPLFQVMLVHQNAPLPRLTCGDVIFNPTDEIDSGATKFDFLWDVAETRQGLKGVFTHRSDIFDVATIAALLRDLEGFIASLVTDPDRPVRELSQALKCKPASHSDAPRPHESVPSFAAPRTLLQEQLAALWEMLFARSPIGVTDNFFDLGGHSLLAVRLFAEIEKLTGKRLAMRTLLKAPTIAELAGVLRQDDGILLRSSLVPVRPGDTKPAIYCISGAGGNVLLFHNLARHLKPDQPVYGLEPPDLDGRQVPLTRLEDIASHYIREMRKKQPEGPYYLAGFSFGGLVAFEIAQQLVAQQQKIGLLAMFDSYQTSYLKSLPAAVRIQDKLAVYLSHLKATLAGPEGLSHLKKRFKAKGLKLLYRLYETLGRPVPPSLAATGTIEDIHVFAGTNYTPRSYPGRVTLFRARIRPNSERFDYEMGWTTLARGGVEVHEVPGDHHTMIVEPNVQVLAAELSACIEKARAQSSRGNEGSRPGLGDMAFVKV